jgi:DNA-binding MarR family transcriptional regulator
VTTILDRLQGAGLASRGPDPKDRRSVLIEATPAALERVQTIWGPLGQEGLAQLAKYSSTELHFLHEFLEKARTLQESHAERIRVLAGKLPRERSREFR